MLGDEQVWLGEKEDEEKQEGNFPEHTNISKKGLKPRPLPLPAGRWETASGCCPFSPS